MNLRNRLIIEAQGNLEMADSENESTAGSAVGQEENESNAGSAVGDVGSVGGAVVEDRNESNAGVVNQDDEYVHNHRRPRNEDPQALRLLDAIPGKPCIYESLDVVTLENLNNDDFVVGNGVLTLELMSIKAAGSSASAKGTQGQFHYKNKNRNENQDGQYRRMFLFRDVKSRTNECAYIIESGGKNKNLWTKNPLYRDDGTITIGTTIALPMPRKITTLMANEIMIVEITLSACVIQTPLEKPECPIDFNIASRVSVELFIIGNIMYK